MKKDRSGGKIWGRMKIPSFSVHSSFCNDSTIINVYRYKTKRSNGIAACNIVVADYEDGGAAGLVTRVSQPLTQGATTKCVIWDSDIARRTLKLAPCRVQWTLTNTSR